MHTTSTRKLLPRQERFAEAFAGTLCLTRAARIAKYAHPRKYGWQLFHQHAGVRARINELLLHQEPIPSYARLWQDPFIRARIDELLGEQQFASSSTR